MATIEERKNKSGSTWKITWYHKGVRQRPITVPSEERAIEWKRLIELHKGDQQKAARDYAIAKSKSPKLSVVAQSHMDRLRSEKFTIQSYQGYMRNHITPKLGDYPVAEISEDDVRRLIAKLEEDLKPKTVHNIAGFLGSVLSHAVKRGDIAASPYHHSMLPDAEELDEREDDKFMTSDEVHKIIAAVKQPWAADAFRFLLATGLRPAELRALLVKDIHLSGKQPVVRVTKAIKRDRVDGDYVGPPKTKTSRRSVGLPPSVVTMITKYTDGRGADEPLFEAPKGGRLGREILRYWWEKGRGQTDVLRKPSVYALRHTHASLMLATGMDIWKLSRHLGHSNPVITSRVYAHLMPEAHYQAAQLAETFTAPAELTGSV